MRRRPINRETNEDIGMATNVSKALRHLHHLLAPPGGDRTDGELLARFVATRDEASFAALVRRHGPMVLSVCRRMLHHVQDAEDCFQATFLVLARRAATVRRESVGSWLYSVAYRTSLEARAVNARRRARERQVQDMPHPEVTPTESQDWRPWLDRELNRLPEKFREAIVRCDLEGRSRKEAARLLGLSEGTLSSRLARGRRLLAKRLAPYGLSLPPVALASVLGSNAISAQVPAALVSSTTQAAVLVAAGEFTAISTTSAILMKGVLKSMLVTKLKLMVGAVMMVTVLGASGLVYRASGQPTPQGETRKDGKPQSELERLRHENELLKLNLEVVLEKVRAQEAELRGLRGQSKERAAKALNQAVKVEVLEQRLRDISSIYKDSEEKERALRLRKEKLDREGVPPDVNEFREIQKKPGNSSQAPDRRFSIGGLTREEQLKLTALLQELQSAHSDTVMWEERANWSERMARPGRQYVPSSQAEADQVRLRKALLDEAEAALKLLREARDSESRQKAADALDKVIKKPGVPTKQPEKGGRH
jgi:RNA polymerase sigma factor (sigma-70 family)